MNRKDRKKYSKLAQCEDNNNINIDNIIKIDTINKIDVLRDVLRNDSTGTLLDLLPNPDSGVNLLDLVANYLTYNNVADIVTGKTVGRGGGGTVASRIVADARRIPSCSTPPLSRIPQLQNLFFPVLKRWQESWIEKSIKPRFQMHYGRFYGILKNVSVPRIADRRVDPVAIREHLNQPWAKLCHCDQREVVETIILAFENNKNNYKRFIGSMQYGQVDKYLDDNNKDRVLNLEEKQDFFNRDFDEKQDFDFHQNKKYEPLIPNMKLVQEYLEEVVSPVARNIHDELIATNSLANNPDMKRVREVTRETVLGERLDLSNLARVSSIDNVNNVNNDNIRRNVHGDIPNQGLIDRALFFHEAFQDLEYFLGICGRRRGSLTSWTTQGPQAQEREVPNSEFQKKTPPLLSTIPGQKEVIRLFLAEVFQKIVDIEPQERRLKKFHLNGKFAGEFGKKVLMNIRNIYLSHEPFYPSFDRKVSIFKFATNLWVSAHLFLVSFFRIWIYKTIKWYNIVDEFFGDINVNPAPQTQDFANLEPEGPEFETLESMMLRGDGDDNINNNINNINNNIKLLFFANLRKERILKQKTKQYRLQVWKAIALFFKVMEEDTRFGNSTIGGSSQVQSGLAFPRMEGVKFDFLRMHERASQGWQPGEKVATSGKWEDAKKSTSLPRTGFRQPNGFTAPPGEPAFTPAYSRPLMYKSTLFVKDWGINENNNSCL